MHVSMYIHQTMYGSKDTLKLLPRIRQKVRAYRKISYVATTIISNRLINLGILEFKTSKATDASVVVSPRRLRHSTVNPHSSMSRAGLRYMYHSINTQEIGDAVSNSKHQIAALQQQQSYFFEKKSNIPLDHHVIIHQICAHFEILHSLQF